ncbi:2Fe-2S iron-sulfur cluster binding domain-containing protein [Mangrovimicrobium sediminis]|uniref:2Fe-2S iron-sulfur cluster binding domain-containing protein n=1 Tax=Mangrovimicrobium sediminis TaxID=2562682 RepID=A0A4Z0LVI0_9GAMM|nr:2Fe-2S iron-sulfur cluster-binding protein [Haliea sp. SAOS-164]TGD71291.1 2Fe-2S iron-sulfur cluster binding domain-containing protein [Haliea sp. SAOS-164]
MASVKFIQPDGSEKIVDVPEGTSLMTAAIDNGVEGILGDCGGACSCATCHCYIDDAYFAKLPEAADVEKSMLEFAVEPKENSRLGCQVQVTEELSGLVVHIPESQY